MSAKRGGLIFLHNKSVRMTSIFDPRKLHCPSQIERQSEMASMQDSESREYTDSDDAYFKMVECRKKLPRSLQDSLTGAFAKISVSSFPAVPGGKVIEIPADTSMVNAVITLSESNILSAPVFCPGFRDSMNWKKRYLGILDYSAVILWVLENTEIMATSSAVRTSAMGAPPAADKIGNDFYKSILQEEPFQSTTVMAILKTYEWVPFIPVSPESSMLSVLLLLSKYRLRNVPVIEPGNAVIVNYITQSAVILGLNRCKGRDWFDYISACRLSELGLPFVSPDQLVTVHDSDLILEAFKKMKDHRIGGLPVTEGDTRKICGSLSIQDARFLLLKPELFANFSKLSVKDFLTKTAPETDGRINKPIMCKAEDTLGDVIDTLASKYVHRIYVVEEGEVTSVITLRDVISCFINEPPGFFGDFFGNLSTSVREILNC